MGEIKNSFLKSKMNKDLDDRLVPNGEYRDAQNISVGKSEDDDIGALETVLGNTLIPPTDLNNADLKIIGYVEDEYKDTVFVFATDYTDGVKFNTIPINAPATKRCIIYSWSAKTPGTITTLVDDPFLNFSTTNPIQATLIEQLLFFTDNRNQPRKISIDKGVGYYDDEAQISVAKYNPYDPISLVKKQTGIVNSITSSTVFTLSIVNPNIKIGMSVVSASKTGVEKIKGSEFITVTNVNGAIITLSSAPASAANYPAVSDNFIFIISTMTNQSSDPTWPGDPNFLEDKFVRFSYRFKFDDGEYSIMAPFTQIAYIPKQKGYFLEGDEDSAFRSTILDWMENDVNNVELLIPLPAKASNIETSYKIASIDVLYKESNALIVKVLETLPLIDIVAASTNNVCTYKYQSRKPYKTLTQAQTVRVYDKVPVRALAQETAGNRIIYGNIHDINTPPSTINYTARTVQKGTFVSDSWIEYPNHSLKQNRSYQVGFVLSDKFGRQSSVILSPVTSGDSSGALGSTIYSPYYTQAGRPNIKNWFGDALQLTVDNEIISGSSGQTNFTTGEPGLYAIPTGNGDGFEIDATAGSEATISGDAYVFKLDATPATATIIPVIGDYLRGEFVDYVKVGNVLPAGNPVAGTVYTVTTVGQVNSSYLNNFKNVADVKFSYSLNQNGWYSYKIVVKQTEQEYYNVYLPGILKGYPSVTTTVAAPFPIPFPGIVTDPLGSTSNIVLINDNINKVPRDLSEVGPEQKQFRSSVQLFGRVQNTVVGTAVDASLNNFQYYPGSSTDTAISVATTSDSNMLYDNLSVSGRDNIYQLETNPLVARISTSAAIGVVTQQVGSSDINLNMKPFLAIYETEPVQSLLDIFWETTSVGVLSDLNADIATGFDGPSSLVFDFTSFDENVAPQSAITDLVYPRSNEGTAFDSSNPTTSIGFSVVDGSGQTVTSKFTLYQELSAGVDQYKYQIKTTSNTYFAYKNNSSTLDVYTFTIILQTTNSPQLTGTLTPIGSLLNKDPLFDPALALISATVDSTVLRPLPVADQGRLIAFNGANASNTSGKTDQLEWTITAGNPTGANGQPCFQINASNGQLTQTPNNTPNGLYSLTITLKDAVSSNVQGVGGKTITAQQQVRIGPTALNNGVASLCKDQVFNSNTQNIDQATVAPYTFQTKINAVWYLSDSTTTGAARTTYVRGTGFPSGTTPSGTDGEYTAPFQPSSPADQIPAQYTIHKLGNAVTAGSVALSMNMQMNRVNASGPAGLEGLVGSWRIYHRTNSTQAWVVISDMNNHTIRLDGIQRSAGQAVRLQTPSGLGSFYLQYVMAYNTPGEYLIAATDIQSITTGGNAMQALSVFCNSSDLFYSTCVIENGSNKCSTSGGCTYEYGISNNSSSSISCAAAGSNSAFSLVPYGQYVDQFFQSSSLVNPYVFTTAATDSNGLAHSNYYNFTIKTSSPYTKPYRFSARFTTAAGINAGKVYNPPSWGTNCFTQNCGNGGSGASCNPLALTFPYSINTTTIG